MLDFISIFPEWYPGLAPHFHMDVLKEGKIILSTHVVALGYACLPQSGSISALVFQCSSKGCFLFFQLILNFQFKEEREGWVIRKVLTKMFSDGKESVSRS